MQSLILQYHNFANNIKIAEESIQISVENKGEKRNRFYSYMLIKAFRSLGFRVLYKETPKT